MKNNAILILLGCVLMIFSCKKDNLQQSAPPQQKTGPLETGLVSLSVNGQLVNAVIDTTHNTVLVTVPSTFNQHTLTVNFTLASQVTATINNAAANSGMTVDLSTSAIFKVSLGNHSTSFTLAAQTEMGYFGIYGNITAQNSLSRDYGFYFDQFDGSAFQTINCGPTSTTMAIKWADSTFTGKPVDARNQFLPQGGWWNTGQIQSELYANSIDNAIDTLSDLKALVKTTIDNGDAMILNPDMNYIPYNDNANQHIGKFYPTTPGWGHYFLVKGYVEADGFFYLDVYDPYSDGETYSLVTPGQIKGKDRYYNSDDVKNSTTNWWPYAIIIAPKGKKVVAATHLAVDALGKTKVIPQGIGR